jgi:hypothetical protein
MDCNLDFSDLWPKVAKKASGFDRSLTLPASRGPRIFGRRTLWVDGPDFEDQTIV